ncbi:hypothetical protein [Methylocystis parvus]|uniref:Uncharacterized protein n=1 Tax=Methylocystis parvus TaxID=134 RepID=A0A6B8M0S1_9HYPH|nr:hypothetical protein [Methylocystis parvus]QGM98407.1 hypothetical protein F7D14_13585 [Methylocystis parvus]WBK01260.1 hypothetical protein MMG94_05980 [Methylocystis parvus OBBP]
MRHLIAIVGLIGLTGCNSAQSAKKEAEQEYAVGSYEQSLKAYQLCSAQNRDEPEKCGALARVMEADKKRYERETQGL